MAEQVQRDRFVAALKELGGSAGNGRLRDALQWDEAAYNAVKEELVAEGVVMPGRGRGGSVSLGGAVEVDAAEPAPVALRAKPARANGNGGNLGFEADLFKAADKLRGNMEPSDYKHVALGLIFLKHISDSFEAKRAELLAEYPDGAEDPDEYAAENIFWVPKEARWSHLQANAKQPSIGKMIDEAMIAIEKRNESLKGVLPKDYARPALNAVMLGELIDLISGIALGQEKGEARDVLGRVYEYFLGQFAGSEGKRGGEFYTPRSVVRVMVEMIEPYKGRVYDPCCGSGGMFVQSEKFALEHEGRIGDIAIYGQESNYTTWRLCKMNLAVRGIDADIKMEQRWQLPQRRTARPEGRFRPRQSALQHFRLGRRPAARGCALEIRHPARWQRQLRMGAAYRAPSRACGHGGGGAGQRLDVVDAERRRRDPAGDDRGRERRARRGRLHGRAARAAFLFDADSRLPLVPCPRQVERRRPRCEAARPARRNPVHRCAQARAHGRPHAQGVLRRRHREDRARLSRLAWRGDAGAYEDVPGFCKSASWRRSRRTATC